MTGIMATVLGISLLIYPLYCLGNSKKIHMILAEATSAFFMLYIIVTAILYSINKYTLLTAESITTIIALTFCILSIFIFKKKLSFDKIKWAKEIIVTIIVILVCGGLSFGNYEAFGMGQDEGVYQTEAINILNGKSEWKQSLKEWSSDIAKNDSNYNLYADWYLLGFDAYKNYSEHFDMINQYPFVDVEAANETEFAGYFHGIPTYPSFLAMSAQIFGISHMAWGNVFLIICTLIFVNEILVWFKTDWKVRNLLLLLVGLCPETVWVNMSTLTEAGITLILVSFIYYLLVCEEEKKQTLAVVALATFSVYHVTIFTLMPLFILILWGMYIATSKVKYIVYSIVTLMMYWLGYLFMLKMNPRYTTRNYRVLTSYIDKYICPTVFILGVTISVIVLSLIIMLVWKATGAKVKEALNKNARKEMILKTVIATGFVLLLGYDIKKIIKVILDTNAMPTLMVYCVLTGIVIVPAIIIVVLMCKYELNASVFVLLSIFAWVVLLYSAAMQPYIKYYYYYSRYLAPFIPIVAIVFGMLFVDKKKIALVLLIIACLFFIPFQYFVHTNKDDSKISWEVIEDVMEIARDEFDENTDVYMDAKLFYFLYFPIRSCSEANIYFVDMDYINDSYKTDSNREIYYISEADYSKLPETVYSAEVTWIEDTLERRVPILQLPTTYEPFTYNISVVNMSDLISEAGEYSIDSAKLKIEQIDCEEDGDVSIYVSGILPDDGLYLNDGCSYISYHIMDADSEEMLNYDNARYSIGNIVEDDAIINVNLDSYCTENELQIDELIFQIDMVQEGVKWLSYENQELPLIHFVRSENGWSVR